MGQCPKIILTTLSDQGYMARVKEKAKLLTDNMIPRTLIQPLYMTPKAQLVFAQKAAVLKERNKT